MQCARFRQLSGTRPSLADCVQRHEAFLSIRTQAVALRTLLRVDHQGGKRGCLFEGDASPSRPSKREASSEMGARFGSSVKRTRRGGRGGRAFDGPESESSGDDDGKDGGRSKPAGRWALPDKLRLLDSRFKEFRAECRKQCADT